MRSGAMGLAIGIGNMDNPAGAAGFDPSDLSNLVAWYEGDLGVTTDGEGVNTWNDQSGNSYHLTQSTGAQKPDVSSTQNSLQVIGFDGGDQIENAAFADLPDKATIFLAAHQTTEEDNVAILDINNGSATNTGLSFLREISKWEFRVRDTGSTDAEYTSPSAPVSKIWTLWYDQANLPRHEIFENGISKDDNTTTGVLANTLSNIVVGALQGDAFRFDGWIASLIIYSDAKDSTDRGLVRGWQNDKWAMF